MTKKPHDSDNPEQPVPAASHEEVESLKARVTELEGMRERLLLAAADFENAKKRLVREKEEFVRFSQERLIRELLPVLDNFERALAHAPGATQDPGAKAVLTGIQMVFKQLEEILKSQGLRRMKALGELFDPHHHEAVGYVEGKGKEHEIVEEVEAGYSLHDRLLRAAKVRVRGHQAESSPSSEEKVDELT